VGETWGKVDLRGTGFWKGASRRRRNWRPRERGAMSIMGAGVKGKSGISGKIKEGGRQKWMSEGRPHLLTRGGFNLLLKQNEKKDWGPYTTAVLRVSIRSDDGRISRGKRGEWKKSKRKWKSRVWTLAGGKKVRTVSEDRGTRPSVGFGRKKEVMNAVRGLRRRPEEGGLERERLRRGRRLEEYERARGSLNQCIRFILIGGGRYPCR